MQHRDPVPLFNGVTGQIKLVDNSSALNLPGMRAEQRSSVLVCFSAEESCVSWGMELKFPCLGSPPTHTHTHTHTHAPPNGVHQAMTG